MITRINIDNESDVELILYEIKEKGTQKEWRSKMITCFVKTPFSSKRYEFNIEGISKYIDILLTSSVVMQREIQGILPILSNPVFLDIFSPMSISEAYILREPNMLRYLIGCAEDEVEMVCYGTEKEITSLHFNLTLFQESLPVE